MVNESIEPMPVRSVRVDLMTNDFGQSVGDSFFRPHHRFDVEKPAQEEGLGHQWMPSGEAEKRKTLLILG